jgi:hypothetical protein
MLNIAVMMAAAADCMQISFLTSKYGSIKDNALGYSECCPRVDFNLGAKQFAESEGIYGGDPWVSTGGSRKSVNDGLVILLATFLCSPSHSLTIPRAAGTLAKFKRLNAP